MTENFEDALAIQTVGLNYRLACLGKGDVSGAVGSGSGVSVAGVTSVSSVAVPAGSAGSDTGCDGDGSGAASVAV